MEHAERVIYLTRNFFGGQIDLDPASNAAAQEIIQAKQYFTKDDDGLAHEWRGRVFLNPPYAQPLMAQFADKMCDERKAGRITAGIMLTDNHTDTDWFQRAAGVAGAICFTDGRVRFCKPDGTLAAPTEGQAFFYFGDDVKGFIACFRTIGFVYVPPGPEVTA